MKILRLLNSKYLSIIFIFFLLNFNTYAEDEPVDIWNIDKEKVIKSSTNQKTLTEDAEEDLINETSIYESQSLKEIDSVKVDSTLKSKEIEIIGLYDPEDFDLEINVWINSDGDHLKNLFANLEKLNLSKDAADLMNILLLTNAYNPNFNIDEANQPLCYIHEDCGNLIDSLINYNARGKSDEALKDFFFLNLLSAFF